MRIESAAGAFEFEIEALKIAGDDIVVVGKMGVWEAETRMSGADVARLFRLFAGSPSFWRYALRLPFRSAFGRGAARRRSQG